MIQSGMHALSMMKSGRLEPAQIYISAAQTSVKFISYEHYREGEAKLSRASSAQFKGKSRDVIDMTHMILHEGWKTYLLRR